MLTHLTYRGLKDILETFPKEHLDEEVVINMADQFFAATAVMFPGYVKMSDDAPSHPYLTID